MPPHPTRRRTIIIRVLDDDAIIATDRPVVEPLLRELVEPYYFGIDELLAKKLLQVDEDDGRLHTRTGFLPLLHRQLERQGITGEYEGYLRSTIIQRAADQDFLQADHAPDMQRFLGFLQNNPRGTIWHRGERDRNRLIATICQVYPGRSIFVLAKSRRQVRRIAAALRRLTVRTVYTNPRRMWGQRDRVHVAPTRRFQSVVPEDWDIVVFADPQSALAATTIWMAARLPYQLLYALLPHDRVLDTEDQFWLRAIVGERTFHALPAAERPGAVQILWVKGRSAVFAGNALSARDRKEERIWNNPARNQLIAEIALALRQQDGAGLQGYGLDLDNGVLRRHAGKPRVAILVEVPEHGLQLQALLPQWPLYSGTAKPGSVHKSWAGSAILTSICAERHGIQADVMIRADGTHSPWLPAWGKHIGDACGPLAIVDLIDDFDGQARHATQRRQEDYARRGWGTPAQVEAITN